LTAALRVFVLGYFRAAATESGHIDVGHGAPAAPLTTSAQMVEAAA